MTGRLIGIARKAEVGAEPELLASAHISVEAGVEGDFRGRMEKLRKVTVIAREAWDAACKDLGRDLSWTTRRANLCVEGVKLPQRIGARFAIGPLVLEVIEETAPCSRMEKAAAGLRAALKPDWRGGVCCNVVTSGEVAIGAPVELLG
ncbi:MAG TPA: MOSC domain-containing protein [Alphaproteobacteria bacterium]|nr:MOSC domain-containing protein [Alphaproteobacteria bacterium]